MKLESHSALQEQLKRIVYGAAADVAKANPRNPDCWKDTCEAILTRLRDERRLNSASDERALLLATAAKVIWREAMRWEVHIDNLAMHNRSGFLIWLESLPARIGDFLHWMDVSLSSRKVAAMAQPVASVVLPGAQAGSDVCRGVVHVNRCPSYDSDSVEEEHNVHWLKWLEKEKDARFRGNCASSRLAARSLMRESAAWIERLASQGRACEPQFLHWVKDRPGQVSRRIEREYRVCNQIAGG